MMSTTPLLFRSAAGFQVGVGDGVALDPKAAAIVARSIMSTLPSEFRSGLLETVIVPCPIEGWYSS